MYLRLDPFELELDMKKVTQEILSSLGPLIDAELLGTYKQRDTNAVAAWIRDASAGGRHRLLITWQGCEMKEGQKADLASWIVKQLRSLI